MYKQLEESNLFYIQNAQETEEALEELRQKLRDTKARMDAEATGLQVRSLPVPGGGTCVRLPRRRCLQSG